jgi:hypothetical protein
MAIGDVVESVCVVEVESGCVLKSTSVEVADFVCVLDSTSVEVAGSVCVLDSTSMDEGSPPSVFAPALIGFEAMGVNPGGAGTVYGVGATVTAGTVTVCCCVSYTVSYAVELTYTMPVLVGSPSERGAVSVTTKVHDSVSVTVTVATTAGQNVLYCSGFSMTVELKLVALVVVGTLVSWRGPYVDLHVVSEKVNETTPGGTID